MRMKGQLEWAVVGIILAVASFIIIIIPFIFTRIHFLETVDAEVVQNNAQLVLLALLSSTNQGKPIYQMMVEHLVYNQYPDIGQIVTPGLEKYSSCYNLQLGTETIAKSKDCDPHKYTATAKIVLPYQPGKKVALLNLTID